MTDTDLKEKEEAVDPNNFEKEFGSSFTNDEKSKLDGLSDQVGKGYKSGNKQSGKGGKRKKWLVGGGIGTSIAGIAVFGILQGPFQFMHLGQILQRAHLSLPQDFGNDRSSRFILYALYGNSARGRLGTLGNFVADKWDARIENRSGVRPVYSNNGSGRLAGYEITDQDKAVRSGFLEEADRNGFQRQDSLENVRRAGRGSQSAFTARDVIAVRDEDFSRRRALTKLASKSADSNTLTSSVGSRLLKKRAGVNFHPMNKLKKRFDDRSLEKRRIREARDAEHRTGQPQPIPDPDLEVPGDPDAPNPNINVPDGPFDDLIKRLRSFAGRTAPVLLVFATVCTIKDFSDSVDEQMIENEKQLIRMAMGAITVGSQVMSNQDLDMATLAALNDDHYDPETETGWMQDPRLQKEMGKEATSPDPLEGNDPSDPRGQPIIFEWVNHFPTDFGPVSVCGIINTAGEITGSIPGISHVQGWVQDAINGGLRAAGLPSTEELVQRAIDYFAGGAVNVAARGAQRGALLNIGSRKAANEQYIATAARELSPAEADEAKTQAVITAQEEFNSGSIYEKYFDIYDSRSLAGQFIDQTPANKSQLTSNIAKLPSLFGTFLGSLFKGNRAYAAASASDYAFPLYGFSEAERSDPRFANPYENEEKLFEKIEANRAAQASCEPNHPRAQWQGACDVPYSSLEELNSGDSSYGGGEGDGDNAAGSNYAANGQKCFGMEITVDGNMVYGESAYQDSIPDECQTSSDIFVRYRFYIADTVNIHSAACYEGNENSCQQLGFGSSTGLAGGGLGISPDGFVFPLKTTRDTITNNSGSGSRWCHQSQDNCHHDYNAADIFAPTGTEVVAARGGQVVRAVDNDGSSVGSRVTIKGDDGNLYYYTHMGDGTITVQVGQTVAAGQTLGRVGTDDDAVGTDKHLHFDVLPPSFTSRPSCSGAECTQYPFINPQPTLIQAFGFLP